MIFSELFHLAVDRIHLNTWCRCSECKQIRHHWKAKSITFQMNLRLSRMEAYSLSYSRPTANSVGELHQFEIFPLFQNHPLHLKIVRFSQFNFSQNSLQTHVNAPSIAPKRDKVRSWNIILEIYEYFHYFSSKQRSDWLYMLYFSTIHYFVSTKLACEDRSFNVDKRIGQKCCKPV